MITWLISGISTPSLKISTVKLIYKNIRNLEIINTLVINNNSKNVQNIYEKINSTGKKLTIADLIRNYLLLPKNNEDNRELVNKWNKLENTINHKDLTKFFKMPKALKKRLLSNPYIRKGSNSGNVG